MIPGIFSLVILAVLLIGGMFIIKSAGGLGLFLQNKGQNKRIDRLEKQVGIILDLALESNMIDANEFSKKLLQAEND